MQSIDFDFPPSLAIGHRVWTNNGYPNHGPLDGPKTDIAMNMSGTIVATEKPYYTMDHLLYTVRWDNGQQSKHYYRELFGIDKFLTRADYEQAIKSAIKTSTPVQLDLGPAGGFRKATIEFEIQGNIRTREIYDRDIWFGCVSPIAKELNMTVLENRAKPRGVV